MVSLSDKYNLVSWRNTYLLFNKMGKLTVSFTILTSHHYITITAFKKLRRFIVCQIFGSYLNQREWLPFFSNSNCTFWERFPDEFSLDTYLCLNFKKISVKLKSSRFLSYWIDTTIYFSDKIINFDSKNVFTWFFLFSPYFLCSAWLCMIVSWTILHAASKTKWSFT